MYPLCRIVIRNSHGKVMPQAHRLPGNYVPLLRGKTSVFGVSIWRILLILQRKCKLQLTAQCQNNSGKVAKCPRSEVGYITFGRESEIDKINGSRGSCLAPLSNSTVNIPRVPGPKLSALARNKDPGNIPPIMDAFSRSLTNCHCSQLEDTPTSTILDIFLRCARGLGAKAGSDITHIDPSVNLHTLLIILDKPG